MKNNMPFRAKNIKNNYLLLYFIFFSFILIGCGNSDKYQLALQKYSDNDLLSAINILKEIPQDHPDYDKAQGKLQEFVKILQEIEIKKKREMGENEARQKLKQSIKYEIVSSNTRINKPHKEPRTDACLLIPKEYTREHLICLGEILKEKYSSIQFLEVDICDDRNSAEQFAKGYEYHRKMTDAAFDRMYKHLRAIYIKNMMSNEFNIWKDKEIAETIKY